MMKGDNNMRTKMFEYTHGWGSIKEQIEIELNDILEMLEEENYTYKIRYISTGKGMIVIVEYQEPKEIVSQ